ncbi:MAG TPA: OmcA/MtrC family decaheme c-type cytochrome [Burkholderiaceae bacterium]|nr:OmcA/MtrC family decaheme c-type cytochrome [Burkholderiaceae bacterium]
MTATITSVTVAPLQKDAQGNVTGGGTVVAFKLATKQGVPVIGFGSTSKSATALAASYPNIAFSLAKLIPASGGTPSKWVSYIVTTMPTTTTASAPTRPSTDNTGTLVDNKDGSYTYRFYRDPTATKAAVDGMTVAAPNNKADLGDLAYDPALTHRLTIQISGNAPGTGTNTPTGADSGVAGVPLRNAVDVVYDFVPSTGQPPAAGADRLITTTSNCNACHSTLGGIPGGNPESNGAGFHGGSRNNVEYCVVCHTDQRKYGRTEAVNAGFPTLKFTGSTYRIDDRGVGNLVNMIHKTHLGTSLAKQAYNYADVLFNEVGYPQDTRNCQNCHTQTTATPQGDNWKTAPSRLACGACHDGINFDTGIGITLKDAAIARASGAPMAPSTGFNGKAHPANATDAGCTNAGCHGVENGINKIDLSHIPVTPPSPNNALLLGGTNANTNAAWIASGASANRLPTGAIKVTYEVSSVSRNASKQPVMVFRLLQNGARKDLNVFASATPNPATGQVEIWDNFMGAPSVYFVWAVPQDGIAKPGDFNASASRLLRDLWKVPASGGTLTGPDANGFYTATLTTVTVPDNAVMLTGGLGYSYNVTSAEPLTQTNLAAYPTAIPTNPTYAVTPGPRTGGLVVIAPNVNKVGTGYTGRRVIVDDKRCNACHQELGTFTEDAFHAGQRNDGTTCSWCHTPNRGSSAWSADSVAFVHAIHGANKRTHEYTWHAVEAPPNSGNFEDFSEVRYPGVLANCEQCHIPGAYNFGNSASADAAGIGGDGTEKRLWRTVATGFYRGVAGATLTTYSGAGCTTTALSSPATALSIFSQPPAEYGLMANASGDGTNPNTGMYYGDGFRYNAGTAASAATCTANGTVVPANPAQGIIQATPETLVMSATVAACTGCHDSNLAISHMRVNGGSFYESRAIASGRTEQCMVCHSAGRTADTKVVHGVR